MRILFIQKMAKTSGSELHLLKLLPLLIREGVECTFLSISVPHDVEAAKKFDNAIQAAGVPFYKIVTKSVLSPKLFNQIFEIYKKGKFDLVHTHLIHADFWGATVKMLFDRKIKLVSTKHGYDEKYQAAFGYDFSKKKPDAYYLISLFAEKFINRSAVVSRGLLDFFTGMGICQSHKTDLIVHGLDFSEEQAIQNYPNCRFFKKQLIIVGRLVPYKGQHFVIDCLPELIRKFPDTGLVLVGSGTSEGDLRSKVQQLGIEEYVRFEGLQPNVHAYLANSDIVLVPSTSEGFGIVLLEAWFHKKPVVAFDVPAPNTIIKNGITGILIKPFDLELLSRGIGALLENPVRQKQLGEAGYESLKADYSVEKMVDATIKFYRKALTD